MSMLMMSITCSTILCIKMSWRGTWLLSLPSPFLKIVWTNPSFSPYGMAGLIDIYRFFKDTAVDSDDTDDPTHGRQQLSIFNGY